MKKIILLIVLFSAVNSRSQNCDSLVPVFNIDFTGISADSTWYSPSVQRNGYCCTATGVDKCINFTVTTDSNTCGLSVNFSSQIPIGAHNFQLCCGTSQIFGDTVFVKPGTHHITYCKPGTIFLTYSIHAFTNCTSPLFDSSCSVITATSENFYAESKAVLFPNPFQSSATLVVDAEQAVLRIFDLPGKLLREENIQRKSAIDRQSLPNGIYYYQVMVNNEVISRGKFMLE